jgi:hypothetical protein
MNLLPLFSLLLILFASNVTFADVYTWTNKDGTREYGDEPPSDAKKAQLPAIQKLKTLTLPKTDTKKIKESSGQFQGYSKLNISSPKQESVITAGNASNLTVQLHISPALEIGHEVILLVDGVPTQKGAQLQFQLKDMNRGSHLLQVQVKYQGKLLITSPKRRIHVQRPSILNRSSSR